MKIKKTISTKNLSNAEAKEVDEVGNIWFLSNATSEHNQNIEREKKVQLIYADKDNFESLSIFGKASISTDRNIIKELYGHIKGTGEVQFDKDIATNPF